MDPVSFQKSSVVSPPKQFAVKHPITPIREYSPIEFLIENNGHSFIDLKQTRLQIKCKIIKPNGDPVTATDRVAFVNLPLQSLWRNIEVYLQNRLVSSADNMYPFKATTDVLLNYSEDSKESQLQTQLYYKDTAGFMHDSQLDNGNIGLSYRWNWTKNGQSVDMEGPLYCDILQQKNLLLNNVPIRIKLTPSTNAFVLMGEGRVIIEEVRLWVCHVDLPPDVYTNVAKNLQKDTAKYTYMKSEFLCHSLNAGSTSLRLDNLFQGRVPTQMVITLVDTDAFNGSAVKNPFNFKHHFLNYLDVNVNGRSLPRERPIEPDFSKNQYVDAYALMFASYFTHDKGNYIQLEEFDGGYAIYVLDIGGDIVGNTKLEVRFAKPLVNAVNIVIYASFPHTMEIDATRNVYL